MKSFLTTTRNYWQIRLDAINAQVTLALGLARTARLPGFRKESVRMFQNDLVALRCARIAARASMRSLGHAV